MAETNAFKWITKFEPMRAGPGLTSLIPDVFPHYFLIPWTLGIMDHFPFNDYPATNWSIADLNKQHAIERELGIFFKKDIDHLYREISQRELAERFDVRYYVDTLSLIKFSPGLTILPDRFIPKIEALLERISRGKRLFLFAKNFSRFITDDEPWVDQESHSYNNISDYLTFQEENGWDTDSCLFTYRRDWSLCTLESFPHLILGCNNAMAKLASGNAELEMFPTNYDFPVR